MTVNPEMGRGPRVLRVRRGAAIEPGKAGLNRTRQNGPMPVPAPDMLWLVAVLGERWTGAEPGSTRG